MFLADVRQRLATLAGVSLPTGTEHQRSFTDLCGPDFLIQGVDRRESVTARSLAQRLPKTAGVHAEQGVDARFFR